MKYFELNKDAAKKIAKYNGKETWEENLRDKVREPGEMGATHNDDSAA